MIDVFSLVSKPIVTSICKLANPNLNPDSALDFVANGNETK